MDHGFFMMILMMNEKEKIHCRHSCHQIFFVCTEKYFIRNIWIEYSIKLFQLGDLTMVHPISWQLMNGFSNNFGATIGKLSIRPKDYSFAEYELNDGNQKELD